VNGPTYEDDATGLGIGTGTLLADRSQEAAVPWSGPMTSPLRKLTHFRKAGAGSPMWSGQCVYDLAGQSPSVSEYDHDDYLSDVTPDQMSYQLRGGVVWNKNMRNADEYTTTRNARVAAQFESAPAARFFQGFANLHWSGMLAGFRPMFQPRPLTQNMNPAAFGTKELHKATQYKPFPPMGSIVGTYGTEKAI
jgi:hypothetical protein